MALAIVEAHRLHALETRQGPGEAHGRILPAGEEHECGRLVCGAAGRHPAPMGPRQGEVKPKRRAGLISAVRMPATRTQAVNRIPIDR